MLRNTIILSLLWLALIASLFFWNVKTTQDNHQQLAYQTARAFFDQIVLDRTWNAGHGGVYVPVTKATQPNPYLDDPQRDLNTENNIRLTKINPAFMTRQISEIAEKTNGIKFHITSLKPIRHENKATEQETKWLKLFEEGVKEKGQFTFRDGSFEYQYMAPLKTSKECLKCHGEDGYKEGDIRGGISVTLPFIRPIDYTSLIIGYGSAAMAGLLLIFSAGYLLSAKSSALAAANDSLAEEIVIRKETANNQIILINKLQAALDKVKTLEGILPICSHCSNIRIDGGNPDDQNDWYALENYVDENTDVKLSHSICPQCMEKYHT